MAVTNNRIQTCYKVLFSIKTALGVLQIAEGGKIFEGKGYLVILNAEQPLVLLIIKSAEPAIHLQNVIKTNCLQSYYNTDIIMLGSLYVCFM